VIELYRAGKAGEAIPLAKRALEIRENALSAGHPDIAVSLGNLALLYHAQGRLKEAEPLYRRALETYENALPAGDPRIAVMLNNLGELYRAQGRYADAEPLHKRALELREKVLPAGHPDIAVSLNNLAGLHQAKRDWDVATDYARRAIAIIIERVKLAHLTEGGSTETHPRRAHRHFPWSTVPLAHACRVAGLQRSSRRSARS
jgi:tetratricopeptide (TPR) repeat protein